MSVLNGQLGLDSQCFTLNSLHSVAQLMPMSLRFNDLAKYD